MNTAENIQQPGRGICNRGFVALLVTMSCGALNDNLYRGMLLLAVATGGIWGDQLGAGGTGWITAMLYAPFVVLLGFTGLLADRYAKRNIIVGSRIVEIGLAVLIIIAMAMDSLPFACVLLVLLASQSAFFSPAKYGAVPELVGEDQLSRANGVLSLLTNVSIVAGLALAGFLLDAGTRFGIGGTVFLGVVMVVIATCGLVSSLLLPHRPATKPELAMSLNGFRTYWRTLKAIRGTDLAAATTAWCLFYAVGSLIIAIIPGYAALLLISDTKTSYLMASAAMGIAIGGAAAGFGSGCRIRAGLAPIGAMGMGISFLLLGLMPLGFPGVLILLAMAGLSAGIWVVPILALLQHIPVPGFRARCVGTANFMTYVAMIVSALLFAILSPRIGAEPPTWFLICAISMLFITAWLFLLLPRLRHGASMESFSSVDDGGWT